MNLDHSPMPLVPVLDGDIESLGVHQVYTGDGTGSGFLIDSRHLLTNCHVVAPFREVAVERRDRSRIKGRVCRLSPQRDLAIVELSEELPGTVLALGDDDAARAKQPVHILGFPVGLPLSLTEGVISHPRQLMDDEYFLQTDAAINPGNSGGPILDDQRRIIAVTTCKLNAADAVGFGIPVADVRRFIEEFRQQTEPFGVQCPACEELILQATRYCPNCGTDLEARYEIDEYFDNPEPDNLVAFVETALSKAGVDPVLARHGGHNWSFFSGSAPVKIWCCCSEHLNLSSPMATTPNKDLEPLFRFLLDAEHAPCFFDLVGTMVRYNLVVHTSDVFAPDHQLPIQRIADFLTRADQLDDLLIERYACQPAPETQMDQLVGHRTGKSGDLPTPQPAPENTNHAVL